MRMLKEFYVMQRRGDKARRTAGPAAALLARVQEPGGRISYLHVSVAVFRSVAETEQYLSSLCSMACLTAASSSFPRRRYRISSLVQTVGGSAARSPEQITSRNSSFCRFFSSTMTMSVAVHAPSARSSSSIGPGALLDWRSESIAMAWPEGLVATNFCSPIHFTV